MTSASAPFRLPTGGRIDRDRALAFTFNGTEYTGHPGDTLASALLANGVHHVATSITYGRPRGIVTAGVEEPSALVQLEAPFPEPMLTATTIELYDGLVARGLRGQGRLASEPDPARYDSMHAHCDVLVVGGGPAGIAEARAASRDGARVILVDDQPQLAVDDLPGVRVLTSTTAFGCYDDNLVLALEGRQRVWRIRAKEIVLATGAYERPVVFADNDRPGIMLAGAARTYLQRYAVVPGRRVVVFTTNDSAYASVLELASAGVEIAAVLDSRDQVPEALVAQCRERGIDVLPGHLVTGTSGDTRITGVHVSSGTEIPCDTLLVSGGWNPVVHLFSQAGGKLRYDSRLGAFVPAAPLPTIRTAGAANGEIDHDPGQVLWRTSADTTGFVDLQRDATVADVLRATGAGLTSVEHVKRYTTIGTAHDQGKTSGVIASGIVAEALGVDIADLGTTTFRPPFTPVAFAALAGRNRGALFDPVRVTALHPWHVAHGALFENVGQWHRPWYYPQPGEDMETAVLRECRAARKSVALMDGSTLGKIDVRGPDAGVFLDRVYTNLISTLKVGSVRYGVMCGVDGMILDDGTVMRVAEHEYVLTTTTGNAAKILEWLEEWLQTEWPELRVHLTSVTEHWVTIPLVGPKSRDVLGIVAPDLDVSNDAFPFMTWREATVAGIPARVCRISFSGELAYEINVVGRHGLTVWEALIEAGAPHGITPYGTETMHVLRAEKGYPIIGQDTDGTVTPQDLGMSWVVSKKKPDFIGKRSFSRAENTRPDRKQLVGLLPVDEHVLLPEGAQLITTPRLPAPPVPMHGHVTSSYRSAALGRTFALALVRSGHSRHGETLYATLDDGTLTPVTVTESVLFDKEGARRDG
ncbi:MAG TPA: 2Fe-2S iron-sulfur cluster-binding protein [Actinospica sp.]|nr:2Fe-2S iron-sulfur cluster-binding protein [Actinospica sp.]